MSFKCPGQDSRNLKIKLISCPDCGYKLEFFSDELRRACPKCKKPVSREAKPTCIEWCKFAEKCAGKSIFEKYLRDKQGGS